MYSSYHINKYLEKDGRDGVLKEKQQKININTEQKSFLTGEESYFSLT